MFNFPLEEVSALLELGEIHAAYSAMERYITTASEEEITTILACADTLFQRPKTGVTKLRDAWDRATDQRTREIIASCGKAAADAKRAEDVVEPDRAPLWTEDNKYQAPSQVRREVRPELRQQPRKRPEGEPRAVRNYFETRAGVDDEPAPRERPDGYALDYDKAGVAPQRGTSCVACFIERPTADFHGRHDDGLCVQCREGSRTGVVTPEGGNRVDSVHARCAYLAEHYPRAARNLMRIDWRHAVTPDDRAAIESYVHSITEPTNPVRNRTKVGGVIPSPRKARSERVTHEPAPA